MLILGSAGCGGKTASMRDRGDEATRCWSETNDGSCCGCIASVKSSS